jgi:thiol-disulfide isomerase/thioredoxin
MRIVLSAVLLASLIFVANMPAQQPPKVDPKGKVDPKAKTDPKAKVDPKAKTAPKETPKFQGKVTAISIGTHISGPKLKKEDLKNRVVLLDLWGIHCAPCLAAMPKTAALNTELSEFGLVIIGAHRQGGTADQIAKVAKNNGANFSISNGSSLTTDDRPMLGLPHCYVFDHTGEGIFEGHPKDVDQPIRVAVGKRLVANAEIE